MGQRLFSSRSYPELVWGHPASYPVCTGVSLDAEHPRYDTNHSPLCDAEFKKDWGYTWRRPRLEMGFSAKSLSFTSIWDLRKHIKM
jgi:hypothetical protein